ncbi:MAG: pyruvate kinase [Planctomycetota bacterium]
MRSIALACAGRAAKHRAAAMRHPNRTKIVATIGPASRNESTILRLARAGADVFRLNAAHCDHATLERDVRVIRGVARQLRTHVGILVDLQGPKIRLGAFLDAEPIFIRRGERLVLSVAPGVVGRAGEGKQPTRLGCGYRDLAKDVRVGERILLDDGYMELRVLGSEGTEVLTRVVHGGLLKQHKGINLPGSVVSASPISAKDVADLRCALAAGVDFIALSFVRTAADVLELRRRIKAAGSDALVVAKVERREAIRNLNAIVQTADAIMVARGDMGVELGAENVPALQKRIIRACVAARKPVITATQMLESMITNPRPTRAEASDVANAIYDGTSAIMLSAETATGKHPVRAVGTMDRIVRSSERDLFATTEFARQRRRRNLGESAVVLATVRAAAYAALDVGASAIAVFTESGRTAVLMAGERAQTPVYAFSPHPRALQRLSLVWGVTALKVSRFRTSHEMTLDGERLLKERKLVRPGARVVVVSGSIRQTGLTSMMHIRTLGSP